jgi:hypothetical protein
VLHFSHITVPSYILHYIQVPVVAIFTKFDGLETMAFTKLRDKLQDNLGIKEAKDKKYEEAQKMLREKYIQPLEGKASDYVQLAAKFRKSRKIFRTKYTLISHC